VKRCAWATDPLMIEYHDREWGVPVHDDRVFFEFLILEGAQAGLSWQVVLRKRDAYRDAFARFDPAAVARFSRARVERLLGDSAIVRNRAKVEGAVRNAGAFLRVQDEFGSFDRYIWRFVDGKPVRVRRRSARDVPASTPLSDAVSKDLRRRDFTFVGTTICYSFLQACGLVDDHLTSCFKYRI